MVARGREPRQEERPEQHGGAGEADALRPVQRLEVEERLVLVPGLDDLRALAAAEAAEHHAEHGGEGHEHDVRVGQLRLGALPGGVVDDEDEGAEQGAAHEAADRALLPAVVLEAGEVAAGDGQDGEDRVGDLADPEQPAAQGPERRRYQRRPQDLRHQWSLPQ